MECHDKDHEDVAVGIVTAAAGGGVGDAADTDEYGDGLMKA